MTYTSLPPLITAIAALVAGLFILLKKRTSIVNLLFFLLCLSTFVWQFSWFLLFNEKYPPAVVLLIRIGYTGIVFIPITFFHFIMAYLGVNKTEKRFIFFAYICGLVFTIANWFSELFVNGYYNYSWGCYPRAGILHPLYLAMLFVLTVKMLLLLRDHMRRVRDYSIKYNQTRYIMLAVILYFPAGADFLVNYGFSVYPIGFVFVLIFLAIFGYAIVRYSLMDIRIAVTRAGLFLVSYSIVLAIPFYIGYSTNSWLFTALSMFVFATAGPFVYRTLHTKAEGIILAEQKRYHSVLLQASEGMLKQHDIDKLLKLTVHIIKRSVNVQFVAAYLLQRDTSNYRLEAIRHNGLKMTDVLFESNDLLIEYLQSIQAPVRFESIPYDVKASLRLPWDMHLIVPSFAQNRLLGFLILGEKVNKTIYSENDINIFKTLSNQAALAIESCFFMQDFRQQQERLFMAEKLASIGGMADGVAHQIKNRLNVFSVAAGEQMFEIDDFLRDHVELVEKNPDLKSTFGYLRETAESLVMNVKKTTGIIQGILNFAKIEEKETMFSEFSLKDVLDQCINLLIVKHQLAEFPLEYSVNSNDLVYGVKAQIIESMYNVIDNGYEAAKEKLEYHLSPEEKVNFKPLIKVKLTQKEKHTQIEIQDNGTGIKEENIKKIFAPFFTTKASSKSGSGIGMYVVKRMVEENHKGRITFATEYGKGTKISIEIPKI